MEREANIFERGDSVATSLLSILDEMEQLVSLAVELAGEYSRLYALLHSVVDEAFIRKIERMKEEGRLSVPREGEKFIPLMLVSTQEEKDAHLPSSVKKVFEKKRMEGNPFYYLLFPEAEGDLESGEKIVRIISSLLFWGDGLSAVVVLLRSFKAMPAGSGAVVINDLTTLDRHNVVESLLSSGISVIFDNETFGGGPIAYCIHVFAKSRRQLSFLDVSLPENMIDDVLNSLVSAVKNALEGVGDQS